MANTIGTSQNSERGIKLLSAQRQIYREAKRVRSFRLLGSVLLAVVAPFVIAFQPDWYTILGSIGGIWLLLDQALLKHIESNQVKQAATIQEEFDTTLFGLPWNTILVGERVAPEIVNAAEHRDKRSKDNLKDWYPDMGSVPYPLDVLLCQRLNLVWDWQLRRHYAWGIFVLVASYISLLIWFAITRNLLLTDFILGLLIPASSAIAEGISVAIDHLRLANNKEETAQKILNTWEAGIKDPKSISSSECRSIQDCIFIYRSTGPLVPDWWYNMLRTRYEIDMYSTAAELKAAAEKAQAGAKQDY